MKKYPFLLFSENADVSIFVEIQGKLSRKNAWLPQFFFVESNSPCKGLLLPRGPYLAQKPFYLVGTILKKTFVIITYTVVLKAPLNCNIFLFYQRMKVQPNQQNLC